MLEKNEKQLESVESVQWVERSFSTCCIPPNVGGSEKSILWVGCEINKMTDQRDIKTDHRIGLCR